MGNRDLISPNKIELSFICIFLVLFFNFWRQKKRTEFIWIKAIWIKHLRGKQKKKFKNSFKSAYKSHTHQARIIHSIAVGVAPRFVGTSSSDSGVLWFCPVRSFAHNQFPTTDSIRWEANINKTVHQPFISMGFGWYGCGRLDDLTAAKWLNPRIHRFPEWRMQLKLKMKMNEQKGIGILNSQASPMSSEQHETKTL